MTSSDKPLISKLSGEDGAKSIPISKKCRICKDEKLLSAFHFSNKSRNKRAATCKTCMEEREAECDDEHGHTDICIKGKFLTGVALVQSGMSLDPDIAGIMYKIQGMVNTTRKGLL